VVAAQPGAGCPNGWWCWRPITGPAAPASLGPDYGCGTSASECAYCLEVSGLVALRWEPFCCALAGPRLRWWWCCCWPTPSASVGPRELRRIQTLPLPSSTPDLRPNEFGRHGHPLFLTLQSSCNTYSREALLCALPRRPQSDCIA